MKTFKDIKYDIKKFLVSRDYTNIKNATHIVKGMNGIASVVPLKNPFMIDFTKGLLKEELKGLKIIIAGRHMMIYKPYEEVVTDDN